MRTIVVAGALANKCRSGGEAWVRLSWTLGLRRLGFDVCFVEQIAPDRCVDEAGRPTEFAASLNRTYFDAVTEEFGLAGSAGLVCATDGKTSPEHETAGLDYEELVERAADAELLVNISGHLTLAELVQPPRTRVYVDLDPGFTQLWHAAGTPGLQLAGHNRYLTVGANIGTAGCSIPRGGLDWLPTPPPIVLGEWPPAPAPEFRGRFTTVATWRSPYGPVEHAGHAGQVYGLKHHEFRKLLELPERAPSLSFEIALDIHPDDSRDLEALRAHGWRIVAPRSAAHDPGSFRAYVRGSDAEFSVAQGVYVDTHSGWFSDRTACYLASGRPALVQDTGFAENYPVGEGLIPFRTLDEAAAGAERIAREYPDHCRAARSLAARHFDSDLVLGRLLDELGVAL